MKYICFGYIEKGKFEGMSEEASEQRRMGSVGDRAEAEASEAETHLRLERAKR